jgi:hypothetical protein
MTSDTTTSASEDRSTPQAPQKWHGLRQLAPYVLIPVGVNGIIVLMHLHTMGPYGLGITLVIDMVQLVLMIAALFFMVFSPVGLLFKKVRVRSAKYLVLIHN